MRNTLLLLACLVMAPLSAGCSKSGEYCDLACNCENCSDNDYDECKIKYEASEDTASAYGCSDQFDRAHECVMNNHDCIADNFAPQAGCLDDIADVNKCISSNSAIY